MNQLGLTQILDSRSKLSWSHSEVRRGLLFLLLVGGVILRFVAVGRQPLWLDEATDASFAARSFWNCVFAEYVHPPLYRALLHFVVQGFGNSAITVRFLPALFGICAIPAMAILARRLVPEAELSATALVATSPFLIYFSQENRNYSLFILLTLLSTLALFRFKESSQGLALYSALSILLLYTHYLAVFVLLAHEIVYWWHFRRQVRDWIFARIVLAVAFAPWFFWAAERTRSESRLFLSPAWLIPIALLRFFLGYGVYVFGAPQSVEGVRSQWIGEAPFVLPSLCLFAWLLWRGVRHVLPHKEVKTLVSSILIIPWVTLVLLAPWAQLTHERYLAFQAPFVLLLIAAGFSSLRPRAMFCASLALALVVGFSLFAYYGGPGSAFGYRFRYAKENWAGTAAFVRQERAEAVILAPGFLTLPMDRYAYGEAREIQTLTNSSAIPSLYGEQRVALVLSHFGPAQEQLRAAMDAAYPRVAEESFLSQNPIIVVVYDTSQPHRMLVKTALHRQTAKDLQRETVLRVFNRGQTPAFHAFNMQ